MISYNDWIPAFEGMTLCKTKNSFWKNPKGVQYKPVNC